MDLGNLSEQEKKLLLDNLLKDLGNKEQPTKKKRKRKRKPKKNRADNSDVFQPKGNAQQGSAEKFQTQGSEGSSTWQSFQRGPRQNQFSEKKAKVKDDAKVRAQDQENWERAQAARASGNQKLRGGTTSDKVEATCKKCKKAEMVSPALCQYDKEDGWVYFCIRCSTGGARKL